MKKILLSLSFLTLSLGFAHTNFAAQSSKTIVAKVNGQNIYEEDVVNKDKINMSRILLKLYEVKKEITDSIIEEKVLESAAKKHSLTVEKYLNKEVSDKVPEPSEAELKLRYQAQKKRYFKDKTYEDVKPFLKQQYTIQKRQILYKRLITKLMKEANVQYLMKKPEIPRIDVTIRKDDYAQGPKNAPITLVEFSEFQCPFCVRARPTVNQILKTYKGKVRYIFKDFPLSFHKHAKAASNAVYCAGDQGKYWEYNKKLWAFQKSQKTTKNLSDEVYKNIAKELDLDADAYGKCISSNKFFKRIDQNQKDGLESGVSGTPAYFINGKFISGAQPYSKFKQIIDEELKLKK